MNIKWIGAHTNNYEKGRRGNAITGVVVHWIVGTLESADATFANPDRIASATYGIGDDEIHQYVKEEDTAYANGNFESNLSTISIEHEGGWLLSDGITRFKPTDKTHETSAQLIADICKRYNIPVDREHIKKHSEVSLKPTACPGLLDIDRIVNRAREIVAPVTPPSFEITDQTKINIGGDFGIMEVQAIRSALKDLSGALSRADADRKAAIEFTKAQLITEYEQKLLTAKIEYEKMLLTKVQDLDSSTLFSYAFKSLWRKRKGV